MGGDVRLNPPRPIGPCACGCGAVVVQMWRGYQPRYINGHTLKGKPRLYLRKEKPGHAAAHERARRFRKEACQLTGIGGCKGRLDVNHNGKDITNNDPSNLTTLCRSHHRLVDGGRIDLAAPVMPTFTVDGGGKRRYS